MKKIILIFLTYCLSISVYSQTPQSYTSFEDSLLSLYAWRGNKMVLLSNSNSLNPTTMNNWVLKMDTAYNFYSLCTGREPVFYTDHTYLNNRSTITEVPHTCGAGCGYVGWTGIEIQSSYFTEMYNYINTQNLYIQIPFYELGRNFWFYSDQLEYKTNDPIVTGYAVFMRFMAMEAAHVQGAPFNYLWSFDQLKNNVINLLPSYMANTSLNWNNTLAVNQGVPGSSLGATDLFASFCFYLRDNYCGNHWVENVWKFAGLRPAAITTQDAVDNFIIANSRAANSNLTSLFQYWKWPVSISAITYLDSLNLGIINSQPVSITVDSGSNAQFLISSSDSNAYYQWQINSGSGFQNINNGGQFSGADSNNLIVSNVTTFNNNDFRCIVTVGTCMDTSITATLQVNTTGISENNIMTFFSVYPSPADDYIYVKAKNYYKTASFIIIDTYGRKVLTGCLTDETTTIDISEIKAGLYFIQIGNEYKKTYKITKK